MRSAEWLLAPVVEKSDGVNGGVKTGHWAAQNQASGGALSAMSRALAV